MGDFNIMIFSNSNFKSTESEFELRLISKSLVNGKIGVLNSQTMSSKYNEFWDGLWISKWAILMLSYGLRHLQWVISKWRQIRNQTKLLFRNRSGNQ